MGDNSIMIPSSFVSPAWMMSAYDPGLWTESIFDCVFTKIHSTNK